MNSYICLAFWIRLPGEYFQQVVRTFGKNYIYSVSGVILALSMLGLNVLFLGVYKLGVLGFMWAMVISYSLSLLYCIAAGSLMRYYRPKYFVSF